MSARSPESLGIVVGVVHMVCVILFQVYYFTADRDGPWTVNIGEYNAALAATIFMMCVTKGAGCALLPTHSPLPYIARCFVSQHLTKLPCSKLLFLLPDHHFCSLGLNHGVTYLFSCTQVFGLC